MSETIMCSFAVLDVTKAQSGDKKHHLKETPIC